MFTILYWNDNDRDEFKTIALNGNFSFFDLRKQLLLSSIKDKVHGRVTTYKYLNTSCPRSENRAEYNAGSASNIYEKNEEISRLCGDVCFLSGRSLRTLFAKYPYRAKYVVCSISPNINWILALPGLIRRLRIGSKRINSRIRFKGVIKTNFTKKTEWWIVIENRNAMVQTHFSLDEKIGAEGLISFLNENNINYVILRFFEKLPNKYREGGDIDMLVADEDWVKVKDFLDSNPGSEMIDMYGVTTPSSAAMLPYYPPYLARKLLNNKVLGPGNAWVPKLEDYLNSFIYHCLYHKGLSSGIETKYKQLKPSIHPDNDYTNFVRKLVLQNNLSLNVTLEDLDDYMAKCGWRPHTDTLEFIAMSNEWVETVLRSQQNQEEIGLNVCILKKSALIDNKYELICKEFERNDIYIVEKEIFSEENAKNAYNHLRGGNWTSGNDDRHLPAAVIVILDVNSLVLHARINGIIINRIRDIKNTLRKNFDLEGESCIHITDNSTQGFEYLQSLYPDRYKSIIEKAGNIIESNKALQLSPLDSLKIHKMRASQYLKSTFKNTVKKIAYSIN